MSRFALNLLTSSAAALILVALAVPAVRSSDGSPAANAPPPARAFGVYVDPWHVDDWARAVGETPHMVAKFEAFSKRRTIDNFIAEAERQRMQRLLVSWEPWRPVPTSLGTVRQARPQPGYRNRDIAKGSQDEYIERFARSLATFDGIVYLRYAHEMNGFWYPWHHDPRGYRRAWRHLVTTFRRIGTPNVRFVWSVNPSLYEPFDTWLRRLRAYWPGGRYVDAVGSTMINFGGKKQYGIVRFAPRLRALRWQYGKPVVITEANTAFGVRIRWLKDFRRMLRSMPWIRAVAWSQLPSRGKAHLSGVGNVNWDVQRDPRSAALLRVIIRDGVRR